MWPYKAVIASLRPTRQREIVPTWSRRPCDETRWALSCVHVAYALVNLERPVAGDTHLIERVESFGVGGRRELLARGVNCHLGHTRSALPLAVALEGAAHGRCEVVPADPGAVSAAYGKERRTVGNRRARV